uniref:universal stress protein n=1 Tax=Fulvivirga sp. TaxID=1931237 RepID=UPI00404B27A3
MEIRNILVPIDFSDCSKNALKVAIMLAKKWSANLHLVNAMSIPTGNVTTGSYMHIEPYIQDQEAATKKYFEELQKEIPEIGSVAYHIRQHISSIPEAIHTEIASKSIDVVVMGTKKSHGLLEKILGSVASEIISTSLIPVMVIPESATSMKVNKIGFAADFKDLKISQHLSLVSMMAQVFNARIVAFNVNTGSKPISPARFPSARKLRNIFAPIPVDFELIEENEVSDGILKIVSEHHLDMLVMLPKHHNFLDQILHKSVTKKMSMMLKVPLLAIHQD